MLQEKAGGARARAGTNYPVDSWSISESAAASDFPDLSLPASDASVRPRRAGRVWRTACCPAALAGGHQAATILRSPLHLLGLNVGCS